MHSSPSHIYRIALRSLACVSLYHIFESCWLIINHESIITMYVPWCGIFSECLSSKQKFYHHKKLILAQFGTWWCKGGEYRTWTALGATIWSNYVVVCVIVMRFNCYVCLPEILSCERGWKYCGRTCSNQDKNWHHRTVSTLHYSVFRHPPNY